MLWQARPNVDWLSVTPTSGIGAGNVTYQVAPFNEVATRQGTLTVAGNTFTVFQYGRRIKLDSYSTTQNYETHVIPITVNALAVTQWSVTPKASWISVVDAGNGHGGDLVTIAIAENPSYKKRTGTVKIGTETFTVTQQGRPTAALSFNVSPASSTASEEGANGTIAVTATPDLPWTATSGANWLTVYAATTNGAGNGNVVYVASPNPTLSKRTGTITITPEAASGVAAKTHTVTQPAATASLSSSGYEYTASGGSCSVDVSCANIVQWSISESLDWITINGSTSRTGPGTVTIQAAANNTVYSRSGTVKIAGKNFSVSQKARGVEVEYDNILFGTDGGGSSISIHPDGNSSWTAVASDATWITIFQGDSGTGDGEIQYVVSPYVGNGTARTGWITIGDKKVYITQRAYDLSIEPNGTNVVGNAGAGEFGVSAGINDVWTAIVTEPWITLVSGYDAGTGNGVVRFLYTENNTGKTRTGKIIVAGEVYTLEQRARQMVAITATAEHGGHVSGGGSYDLGSQVTLTAVPESGYKFSYWTGAVSSMQNPLTVTADVAKSYTAVFEPLPIAFTSVNSDTNGVTLAWNNLAWAGTYRIFRGITSVPSSATVLAELPNNGNCTYLDETGEVDTTYWYWIEAEGPSDEVMSEPMTGRRKNPANFYPIEYGNLRGADNANPLEYEGGTSVVFANLQAVTGYTFAGWTPSQITPDMTGAQTVCANWTPINYVIAYSPNGGSGTMDATACTYDTDVTVATNLFRYAGHLFDGWATEPGGAVVYSPGQRVVNLSAEQGDVITLYAVWHEYSGAIFYIENGELKGAELGDDTEIVIPDGVRTIAHGVFYGKTSLKKVTIPGSVEYVSNQVFDGCTGLTDVVLREGMTMIGDSMFTSCSSITNLTIPSSVTNIGSYAFSGCKVLTNLTISANVKRIGYGAFANCSGLESMVIPDTVDSLGGSVKPVVKVDGLRLFYGCAKLKNVRLPSWLSGIGKEMFYGCKALTDITLPEGVTQIEQGAFQGCSGLKNIVLPDGLSKIDNQAFMGCGSFTDILIPDGIRSLGNKTFANCGKLKLLSLPAAYWSDADDSYLRTDICPGCSSSLMFVYREKEVPADLTLEGGVDQPTWNITTDEESPWMPIADSSAIGGSSVRSGCISPEKNTWMEVAVSGAGILSFNWKADCEKDPRNRYSYDYGAFMLDRTVMNRIDGTTEWQTVTIKIADGGTHVLRWTYAKDDYDEDGYAGEDCIWVDNIVWTPDAATEPFPEVATNAAPGTVAAALSGAADAGLVANVVDGTNYNAFREWAARVKGANGAEAVGAQTVKESAKAWLSYALGSDRLIAKEITSNDVHIVRFAVDDGAATGGSRSPVFAFEVAIDGVNIGGGSVPEVVLKENLKKVLGMEGAASLTPSAFLSDNIDITFDTPVDGKAKFTVAPPADAGNSFFMRVKVK